jgi:hypothetical protein
MGYLIQLIAIVITVFGVAALISRRSKRKLSRKAVEIGPRAQYDQMTSRQMAAEVRRTGKAIYIKNQSLGSLMEDGIIDRTRVSGTFGTLRQGHVPTDACHVAMFDNRRIVLVLSTDDRTLIHQVLDPDGSRYWVHIVRAIDGRSLESAFRAISDHYRDSLASVSQQAR